MPVTVQYNLSYAVTQKRTKIRFKINSQKYCERSAILLTCTKLSLLVCFVFIFEGTLKTGFTL